MKLTRGIRRPPARIEKKPEDLSRVDAVLMADMHYRADIPVCRTDDYLATQDNKLKFIFDLCRQYECPLFIAGDIGHRSQWPNWLLERFMALAEGVVIHACLGQHDLPSHSIENLESSGCGVLSRAGVIDFESDENKGIDKVHFGITVPENKLLLPINILLTHQLVVKGKEDWPGQQAIQLQALLRKHLDYKLILSGDNHISFVGEYQGRLVVNPGSMMRMTASQADHKPRVYLWDAQANQVAPVYLPAPPGVVDRTHIEDKQEQESRLKALVERVKMDYETGFSYEDNMKVHLSENKTKKAVEKKIWEAME